MKVPADALVPEAKLTRYLLVPRPRNDKSKFLARAGFSLDNPEALEAALRQLIESSEAIEDRKDEYGTYYQVIGPLLGANGIRLNLITVWLQRETDGQFQFVTLFPNKEQNL